MGVDQWVRVGYLGIAPLDFDRGQQLLHDAAELGVCDHGGATHCAGRVGVKDDD